MISILVFIFALGILVLVHEWGHFIVAKKSGVRVDVFSIGFGPKVLGFKYGGTDYRIAPIPLGGYVRIYGQDPLEEANGDPVKAKEIAEHPTSFHSKKMWQKLAVVLAGPAMNLIFCLLIMPFVFMIGRMQPKIYDQPPVVVQVEEGTPAQVAGLQKGDLILSFNDKKVGTWQELMTQISLYPDSAVKLVYQRDGQIQEASSVLAQNPHIKQSSGYLGIEPFHFVGNEPLVDSVQPDSPAAAADFQPGDKIRQINDKPIKYWTEMTELVQKSEGQELQITVERQGKLVILVATAKFSEEQKTWILGLTKKVDMSEFAKKRYGPGDAFVLGLKENYKLFTMTFEVLGRLFTGNLSYKSLGGPIQIAQATSTAAQLGLGEFIYLLSFLSMQLGVMNLLPIPVLDGGHIFFMLIETVRRKPLSPKFRQVSMQVGMLMLLTLMVVVTINDVDSVWGFSNILNTIKSIF